MRRLAALSPEATRALLGGAVAVAGDCDLVLVDTAAGIRAAELRVDVLVERRAVWRARIAVDARGRLACQASAG